jgi:patatin-like phospholipase/acyl hydrolase
MYPQIKELFDLVVGSRVGGLVAMLISLKNESVSNYLQLFLEYPQRIFKTNFLAKLGIWSKSKYKMKAIEEFVKELFGDTLTMTNVCKPENALVCLNTNHLK